MQHASLKAASVILWAASLACHAQSPPRADIREFSGRYELELPDPDKTKIAVRCDANTCTFSLGKNSRVHDTPQAIRPAQLTLAKEALKYARDRRKAAVAEAPFLASLLDSGANIQSCIDLGPAKPPIRGGEAPGFTLLCKLDRPKSPVLYMETIAGDCGPASCRYAILPLSQRQDSQR